jgi:C2 domain
VYDESRAVPEEKRWWHYGKMLHCIQDSFSLAHTARVVDAPNMPIRFSQDYSKQVMGKHGASDTSPSEDAELLRQGKTDANSQLKKKIADRKQKLYYARALAMSKAFVSIVFADGARDASQAVPFKTKDLWPRIHKLLDEQVFVLDKPNWAEAVSGGSLPDFAKDKSNARALTDMRRVVSQADMLNNAIPNASLTLTLTRIEGSGLIDADIVGRSDPFVMITAPNGKTTGAPFQTVEVLPNSRRTDKDGKLHVVWNFDHDFTAPPDRILTLSVYDNDKMIGMPSPEGSDFMGKGVIKMGDFLSPHYSDTGSFDREVVNSMDGAIEKEVQLYMSGSGKQTRHPAGKLIVRGAARTLSKLPGSEKGEKGALHGLLSAGPGPGATAVPESAAAAAVMGTIKHNCLGHKDLILVLVLVVLHPRKKTRAYK